MNNKGLLTEEEVLSIIKEEFGSEIEEEFDMNIPGPNNGVILC